MASEPARSARSWQGILVAEERLELVERCGERVRGVASRFIFVAQKLSSYALWMRA